MGYSIWQTIAATRNVVIAITDKAGDKVIFRLRTRALFSRNSTYCKWLGLCAIAVVLFASGVQAQTRSRTERFAYEDNAAKWVMGQVKTVTCVSSTEAGCSNTVVAEATHDATTASQLTYKSFGKLLLSLTYNTDGTVATVKDGNNKITGLSSWYRGVPQTITYPDTTTETAVVSGFGWISSSTDETQSKTCFEYDDMGRLKKTIYPSECPRRPKSEPREVRTISWTTLEGSSCFHTRIGFEPCGFTSSWAGV